jgi:hypothetical protein
LSNPFLAVCSLFVWLMADGWWLVLIYPERKVLVAGLFWEKSTDGWCLISQTNRLVDYVIHSYYRTCLLWLTSHGSSAGSRSRSRTKDPRAPCSCWPRREKRSRFQFSERIGKVKKTPLRLLERPNDPLRTCLAAPCANRAVSSSFVGSSGFPQKSSTPLVQLDRSRWARMPLVLRPLACRSDAWRARRAPKHCIN